MTLEHFWKKYNVSSIFVLPLFSSITQGVKAIDSVWPYPFFQLCIEYGLINT